MVPALLSSNLCSLRGGEERYAFSCLWEMTEDAEIVRTEFTKSVICSKEAFMYSEAQMVIDDVSDQSEMALGLRALNRFGKLLRGKRIEKGALMLASPEVRFSIDSETHDPVELQTKQTHETNSLVEEFMLLANVSVAAQIFKHFPACAVLRRHPTPPPSNFEPLLQAAASCDVELSTGGWCRPSAAARATAQSARPSTRRLACAASRGRCLGLGLFAGTHRSRPLGGTQQRRWSSPAHWRRSPPVAKSNSARCSASWQVSMPGDAA